MIDETILERLLLISDLDFNYLISQGLIYGFIISLTAGLFTLAIYYALKFFFRI